MSHLNVIALHYIPVQHSIGSVAILPSSLAFFHDGWPQLQHAILTRNQIHTL